MALFGLIIDTSHGDKAVPSDSTIQRAKKRALYERRDNTVVWQASRAHATNSLQFDGKVMKDAVIMSGLLPDGTIRTLPMEVIELKSHPTGKKSLFSFLLFYFSLSLNLFANDTTTYYSWPEDFVTLSTRST